MPEWLETIVSILSGLVVIIPLVAKLVEFVAKATREKNWGFLLDFVMKLMQEAESKFQDGASRKEWVLMMVKASADNIQYDINLDQVSEMIDSLCNLTKIVNAQTSVEAEVQQNN